MNKRPPNRRKKILIDGLQYRLLGFNLLYFSVFVFALLVALFGPLFVTLYSDTAGVHEKDRAALEFLALHARIWPAAILMALLFGVHATFVSHRIAGPLYRFRKVHEAVAAGDISQTVVLRKHDYLTEDAETINRMLVALRGSVQSMREHCALAQGALDRVAKGAAGNPEMAEAVVQIAAELASLRAALGALRTERTAAPAPAPAAPQAAELAAR
ncbi:MAG: methyl-accepting chemotaxis protein [Acidobacteria bacterium]|nr:methyl-accepting chemotaxis protein [Acidobacteriota bacterium]